MLIMAAMFFPCKGEREEFAVAVEVFGVSAFFTLVSLSSAPLRELNAPTPRLPGGLSARRAPTPRPW